MSEVTSVPDVQVVIGDLATAEGQRLREALDALARLVHNYADHQSWRCGHPERYPWNPDCPCGLVGKLKEVEQWL